MNTNKQNRVYSRTEQKQGIFKNRAYNNRIIYEESLYLNSENRE